MPADTSAPARLPTPRMGRLPVPHVVMWSGETATQRGLTARAGLCFQDEKRADRDRHGVLWSRMHQPPGTRRPNYRALHPGRQRQAIQGMLCQVCGGPVSHTWDGLAEQPAKHSEKSTVTERLQSASADEVLAFIQKEFGR